MFDVRFQVIGNKWEPYLALLNAEYPEGEALDALGLKRYCCRRMLLTHVDLIEKLLLYNRKWTTVRARCWAGSTGLVRKSSILWSMYNYFSNLIFLFLVVVIVVVSTAMENKQIE